MSGETTTLRVSCEMTTATYCTTADTIVVRKDGSIAMIPKGTLIAAPVPNPPYKLEVLK